VALDASLEVRSAVVYASVIVAPQEEGEAPGRGLILRGSAVRLSPILTTGLATALALLPIALAGNKPGQEIEHPMAVVILGGLLTSTLLNLVVMPVLYGRFGVKSNS
jgi:Cu/Ag efflux pump CusA